MPAQTKTGKRQEKGRILAVSATKLPTKPWHGTCIVQSEAAPVRHTIAKAYMSNTRPLVSFRLALLSSLGLLHACGARSAVDADRTDPIDDSGRQTGPRATDPTAPDPFSKVEPTATNNVTPSSPVGTTPVNVPSPTPPSIPVPAPVMTNVPAPPPTATPPVQPMPSTMVDSVCEGPEARRGLNLSLCANGITHRFDNAACESIYPRPEPVVSAGAAELPLPPSTDAGIGGGPNTQAMNDFSACTSDSDCTDAPHGYCNLGGNEQWGRYTYCNYGCVTDDDCEGGNVCECGEGIGQCVTALCRVDGECDPGHVCARFAFEDGCGTSISYACTTDQDECRTEAECDLDTPADQGGCRPSYRADAPGARCEGISCVEGRPFLVHGQARVAAAVERGDWMAPVSPGWELDSATSEQLAAHWTSIGQMEHASIAAFARFSMQLLSLGAPPELLEATHRAMADETLHARLAFGLASHFGAAAVGPGPLSFDGALQNETLESITLNTLLEGCIGETFAAMEARTALGSCTDAGVRAVLRRIVADETEHARLAWHFVQWALQREPALAHGLRARVAEELELARRAVGAPGESDSELLRFGVTSDAQRAELRVAVLVDVVSPCLDALIAPHSQLAA